MLITLKNLQDIRSMSQYNYDLQYRERIEKGDEEGANFIKEIYENPEKYQKMEEELKQKLMIIKETG